MNNRLKIIISAISTAATAICLVGSSFAWFGKKETIDTTNKLGGKFLNGYFHSGDGSEEDPFVITKPFHYENMIKFHYEYQSFANAGYHFQFGSTDERMPGNPTTPVFYATNSDGTVDTSNYSTMLDFGGEELPPLGTAASPFKGYLNGNDLIISNFVIAAKGYRDVGVFGYVESNTNLDGSSPIHNCYYRNYTIDTTATSNLVNQHDVSAHPEHAHYNSDSTVEVGYLAGHTVYSAAFSDCYVNNCSMSSTNNGADQNTTYGYFGMVENDYLGGDTGRGNNYSFELDSEAIYRTTRQVYDSIAANPIRTRSGYTEYTTPINNDVPEIYTSGGTTVTKYPISSAISRSKAVDNNDTYTIEGKTPSNKSAARNYSFSTLGYQPTTTNVEPVEYEAYYTRGSSTKQFMPSGTVLKTDWNGSPNTTYTGKNGSASTEQGDFLYHDGTSWKYIHAANKANEAMSAKSFTIKTTGHADQNFTGFAGLGTTGGKSYYAYGYFYIDNVLIHSENLTSKVGINAHSTNIDISNVSFNTPNFTANLTRGKHYFEYYYVVEAKTKPWLGDTVYSWYWFSNSKNSIDNTGNANLSITAGTFEVTQEMYDSSDRSISFNCTDHSHRTKSTTNYSFVITNDTRAATAADIPQYVSSNTFEATLYGYNSKTEATAQLNDDTLNWRKDTGVTQNSDGSTTNWHKWIAFNTPARTIDTSQSVTYLSDNSDITPRISDGTYWKGYEWKNIDLVGGGVSFYYKNFGNLFDVKVIGIPAENTGNYVTGTVPTADINNKATFYSTKYCPGSIVMYFKNTANAADANDHTLGNIDFTYVNASALGMSWINLSTPSFKKGAGNFLTLDNFGDVTGDGLVDYETTFSASITESGAKKCSYCALDSQRRILGVFNADGTPGTGFIKSDNTPDVEKLLQIDTYVIALGSDSNIVNQAWITDISFEYVSNEGYGGTFGSVEYRNTPDTADETIFTFFVNVPSGADYLINVIYREDAETIGGINYVGKNYYITVISSVKLTMNIYIYNSDYVFTLNGQTYSSSQIGIEISPS